MFELIIILECQIQCSSADKYTGLENVLVSHNNLKYQLEIVLVSCSNMLSGTLKCLN